MERGIGCLRRRTVHAPTKKSQAIVPTPPQRDAIKQENRIGPIPARESVLQSIRCAHRAATPGVGIDSSADCRRARHRAADLRALRSRPLPRPGYLVARSRPRSRHRHEFATPCRKHAANSRARHPFPEEIAQIDLLHKSACLVAPFLIACNGITPLSLWLSGSGVPCTKPSNGIKTPH